MLPCDVAGPLPFDDSAPRVARERSQREAQDRANFAAYRAGQHVRARRQGEGRLPVVGSIHTHLQVTHGIDPHVVARMSTRERAERVHHRIHHSGSHQTHDHGASL